MLAEARAEKLPLRRLALPFHAPHLARALRTAAPGTPALRTTIDPLNMRGTGRYTHVSSNLSTRSVRMSFTTPITMRAPGRTQSQPP